MKSCIDFIIKLYLKIWFKQTGFIEFINSIEYYKAMTDIFLAPSIYFRYSHSHCYVFAYELAKKYDGEVEVIYEFIDNYFYLRHVYVVINNKMYDVSGEISYDEILKKYEIEYPIIKRLPWIVADELWESDGLQMIDLPCGNLAKPFFFELSWVENWINVFWLKSKKGLVEN